MKRDYGGHFSRLEGEPSNVDRPENDFFCSATKIPNIIEEDDESVSERVTSFVVVLTDIPLRVNMEGVLPAAS